MYLNVNVYVHVHVYVNEYVFVYVYVYVYLFIPVFFPYYLHRGTGKSAGHFELVNSSSQLSRIDPPLFWACRAVCGQQTGQSAASYRTLWRLALRFYNDQHSPTSVLQKCCVCQPQTTVVSPNVEQNNRGAICAANWCVISQGLAWGPKELSKMGSHVWKRNTLTLPYFT